MILINSNYLGFACFKKMNDKFLDKKCIVGKNYLKRFMNFYYSKRNFQSTYIILNDGNTRWFNLRNIKCPMINVIFMSTRASNIKSKSVD